MPRLPDCRIVGKELTFVFPSNGDALVGYRMIRDAVDAAEKAAAASKADFLEVGVEYFDREGNIWTVTGPTPGRTPYPYLAQKVLPGGKSISTSFCANGRYFLAFGHRYDLIRWVGAAPKTEPAPKAPLQLRVGAHYKRSDGMTGRVVFRSTTSGACLWEGTDGLRRAYNEDGTARHQFEGVKNLIEEVTPCPTIHDCRAGQTERCTCYHGEG